MTVPDVQGQWCFSAEGRLRRMQSIGCDPLWIFNVKLPSQLPFGKWEEGGESMCACVRALYSGMPVRWVNSINWWCDCYMCRAGKQGSRRQHVRGRRKEKLHVTPDSSKQGKHGIRFCRAGAMIFQRSGKAKKKGSNWMWPTLNFQRRQFSCLDHVVQFPIQLPCGKWAEGEEEGMCYGFI